MNRKQLTLLLVVGLVLGVLGLFLYQKRNRSWQGTEGEGGQQLIPKFPLNDVAQVHIKSAEGSVSLVKINDLWRVQDRAGYPANFASISDFLQKIWNMKVVQTEQVGSNFLGRLELLPPDRGAGSGTLVEFKDKEGKALQSLTLGKQQMRKGGEDSPMGPGGFPVGRWVKVSNANTDVAVISDPLSNIAPKPDQWLEKEFVKVEKIKSIALQNDTNSWKITRENESSEWKLADAKEKETLDSAKVASLPGSLGYPSFVDVKQASAPAAETGLDKPVRAVVETFDALTYTLLVGKKDASGANYHVKIEVTGSLPKERTKPADEKPEDKDRLDKEFADNQKRLQEKLEKEQALGQWIYLMPSNSLDPLIKSRDDLLKKEEPPAQTQAPAPGVAAPFAPLTPAPGPNKAPAPKAPTAPKATNAPPSAPDAPPAPPK